MPANCTRRGDPHVTGITGFGNTFQRPAQVAQAIGLAERITLYPL